MAIWTSRRTLFLAALMTVLLGVLAVLQHRWVGELSEFERQQMERTLRASTGRFVRDFAREFEELRLTFHARRSRGVEDEIIQEYGEWAESFEFPSLLAEAYWVSDEADAETTVAGSTALRIQRVDLEEGRFSPAEWPALLRGLRGTLGNVERPEVRRGSSRIAPAFSEPLNDELIAFVVPQEQLRRPGWAIAVLRRDVLVEQFIPFMVQEYFGPEDEREYDIWLVDAAHDAIPIYATNSALLRADVDSPDLRRSLADERFRGGGTGLDWSVVVKHRAGSLAAAVGQSRQRNLSLSFGVLAVLSASILVLGVATRRAERLADRQMEFVAGVSHELRTPITGISSLSQNLADGVVQDVERVADYGRSINRESHRLANMVEGVLHFSAIRTGRYHYDLKPVDVGSIVASGIDVLDSSSTERLQIKRNIAADLPPVLGDSQALTSVVRNLVSNALKFSGENEEIEVSTRLSSPEGPNGPEVEFCVEDRGRGIEKAEISQIFEPFYRGRAARESQVEGSGLGLSLVREVIEAHGGRVDVTSDLGKGSKFSVYLPVTTAGSPMAPDKK